MRTRIPGVMAAVQSTAWAIMPDKLHAILDVLEARAAGAAKSKEEIRAVMGARARGATLTPKAGSKIAVLPLYGMICQRANMVTEYSGGTSTEQFATSLDAALANAEVGAIVIDCDSPGGSVDGVTELAARVLAARGKGKPIIAVANVLMASAAYWICAAADEIVATPSALIGSIGVFWCHTDESGADQQAGITRTLIAAGKYKTEGNSYEPLSDEARAAQQAMVDEFYALFIADVAAGREVKAAAVKNGFGEGRVLPARQAVAEGMADRIGTLEQVLADLGAPAAGTNGRARRATAAAAAGSGRRVATAGAAAVVAEVVDFASEFTARRELAALGLLPRAAKKRADDDEDLEDEDEDEDELEDGDDEDDLGAGDTSEEEEGDGTDEDDELVDQGDSATGDDDDDDETDAANPPRRSRKSRKARARRDGLRGAFNVSTGGAADTRSTSSETNRPHVAKEHDVSTTAPARNGADTPDPVALERKRVAAIMALCAQHQVPTERWQAFINDGTTVEAAGHAILTDRQAAAAASPIIRVGADREAERPFAHLGDQLQAIIKSTRSPGAVDKRLLHVHSLQAAASGMGEATPSDGGFAVQTDFATEILRRVYTVGQIMSRVRTIPISESANGLKINAVDETSRATGSRYGGIQAYWANEADTVTAKKPKLRQMQLELRKLFAIWYLTDELVQDSTAMGALAMDAFSEEIIFMTEDGFLNGPGNGQPFGIYNSGAVVQVAKEGGQAAQTVNITNIAKMFGRLWARSMLNAVWVINQDVFQQLLTMTLGNWPVYMPPVGGASMAPYGTLLGRPLLPVEYAATLGTPGDIALIDFQQYLAIDKGGPQQAQSIHVRFLNDEMTFRVTYRVDGQPIWNVALTPKNGTNTLSPYITLQTR